MSASDGDSDDNSAGPGAEESSDSEARRNNGVSSPKSQSGGLEDWMTALREMAPYLDLGWRLAGAAAGPPLLGYFLVDLWFGTTPWGVLTGCALGLAAAGLQLKKLQDDFGR